MITTGQLRIFVKDFIRKITRPDIVQADDIRYIKSGNGVFPRKMVWYGTAPNLTFKETPFLPNDTFVLFDALQDVNKATEVLDTKIKSHLPFKIIINIYGENCEDEAQYLIASLHKYDVIFWLQKNKMSLVWVPEESTVLDGRENATWWKRRRIELKMNTQQEIDYYSTEDTAVDDINLIVRNVRVSRE